MREFFHQFAQKTSLLMGSPLAFGMSCLMVLIWALSGKYFDYSDTWELLINTATTIVTFLMVFIIQNSQNRDMRSLHLKLDELIRSIRPARNGFIELETLSEAELDKLEKEFTELVRQERKKRGGIDDS